MKIKVYKSVGDEGGYMYDIWLDEDADEDTVSPDDGGLHLGTHQK